MGPALRANYRCCRMVMRGQGRNIRRPHRALLQLCAALQHAGLRAGDSGADVLPVTQANGAANTGVSFIIFSPKSCCCHKESVRRLKNSPTTASTPSMKNGMTPSIRRRSSASSSAAAKCFTICAPRAGSVVSPTFRLVRIAQLYPFAHDEFKGANREVQQSHRDRVVSGRTAQPGRMASHTTLSVASSAAASEADVRRP